ncbi:PREDICTED: interleukin-11 [Gekko japonicus]|uniref:Interleukin-11 n=1 Tax=Gekko japonicus TaxID=146911 RepID=A0ABM1K837_GEKJA|nr:PREDICTED: interleukin-11 [Gekko japonicus]
MKNWLCRVLVMLLSLCEGFWAVPGPRLRPSDPRAEFDSIVNLARNLLSDTKNLFNHFKNRYPAEGEHKLETLPVLSMNAVELANIQMVKLSLPRPNDPLPTLPSHGTHWSVVQAGHAIVHSFHLYLDWAARALVLIRNKL